jgi:hypothetical protein
VDYSRCFFDSVQQRGIGDRFVSPVNLALGHDHDPTVAVLSLALGVGANTAVFSLMLRLLPVREPGQLVELLQHYPGEPRGNGFWSGDSDRYYRDRNHVFSGLVALSGHSVSWRGEGLERHTGNGAIGSANFLAVLGLRPARGRLLGPRDEPADDATSSVVLSWSLWKNQFQLDPAIVGKQIVVQDRPATIVGVTPAGFTGMSRWAWRRRWRCPW